MSEKKDIHLSKILSWLLRHGAVKEGLQISSEGYIDINVLLKHTSLKNKFTVDDIKRVVRTNDKQRFTLRHNNNILEIRANQGHSLKDIDNLALIPILDPNGVTAIHGTFYRNWGNIKSEGINRMKRNHIHFASGLRGDKSVVSGIRNGAEVFIYINVNLAISDGIKFYKSANGVVLSPGNDKGIIEPKFFLKVCDINGETLS